MKNTVLLMLACLVYPLLTVAEPVQFSAHAYVAVPGEAVKHTLIYVGKDAVRSELKVQGMNIVEIVKPADGQAFYLNPAIHQYRVIDFPKEQSSDTKQGPCKKLQNAECKLEGKERINNIKTEKWEVITRQNGQTIRSLHWIDSKRKLAIKEKFPDGSIAELENQGKEKVSGRITEKWQRILTRPDGTAMVTYQWYDPELKIAIKEELPGGYSRELKNIKVGQQDPGLFSIPTDYRVVSPGYGNLPPAHSNRQP